MSSKRGEVRCEKCGEERLVDIVVSGRTREAFCACCGHAWPLPPRSVAAP
jgi:uncharacterized Zn finger protein